jgi:glyoxylase-like metal-dependent hydrolase (beta-lactamase superfamily II)
MILERSMHPGWLSNTYLLADEAAGRGVLIDAGGPPEPILRAIEARRLAVSHVLCTHHHVDHTEHGDLYRRRLGCRIVGGAAERDRFRHLDEAWEGGETIACGALRIRALHIPGHTRGQLAFLVDGACVFTGDTLFRGSVGGTRAPGHATFADLRRSILDVLMALPPATAVHPGHAGPTTIGEEWERNPFVRLWRGLDGPSGRRCVALGRPATLLLRAVDYDGGGKCQVRFDDGGEEVVPGSRVADA